jgi:formylglycine-generating enzyme required for sulfatase activity
MAVFNRRVFFGAAASVAVVGAGFYGYRKQAAQGVVHKHQVVMSDGRNAPLGMALIPAGKFLMGSDHKQAQANEQPTHWVSLAGFWMDVTHVTNDQFAKFVEATHYVTTAEKMPDWETIRVQLPPGTPRPDAAMLVPGAMVFTGSAGKVRLDDYSQWWSYVAGADWRHPHGPQSNILGKGDHPVVQVSHADASAYAAWIGKRLPTEAEWEYAARGGLNQATYAWGDQLEQDGRLQANIWDVRKQAFPVVNAKAGGAADTTAVGTFPANGYGLSDMTGNAWQWVDDWYRFDYFQRQAQVAKGQPLANPRGPVDSFDPADQSAPADAPKKVIRGGSFLCNEDYCQSYRPSARRGTDPFNPMSHLGFRLIKDV